ncbi:hypothetical protein WCL09_17510 [Pseudomonas koreensis]|uniref:hypothetical protein n=1 Tax=Pseudomonas koreensis TaxID=198620 RepID=UPI003015F7B6
MTAKLVEFKREGWRNAAKTMRKIADDLESGEIALCATGALSMRSAHGRVTIYGYWLNGEDL